MEAREARDVFATWLTNAHGPPGPPPEASVRAVPGSPPLGPLKFSEFFECTKKTMPFAGQGVWVSWRSLQCDGYSDG
eukprot:gene20050-biopygen20572